MVSRYLVLEYIIAELSSLYPPVSQLPAGIPSSPELLAGGKINWGLQFSRIKWNIYFDERLTHRQTIANLVVEIAGLANMITGQLKGGVKGNYPEE